MPRRTYDPRNGRRRYTQHLDWSWLIDELRRLRNRPTQPHNEQRKTA